MPDESEAPPGDTSAQAVRPEPVSENSGSGETGIDAPFLEEVDPDFSGEVPHPLMEEGTLVRTDAANAERLVRQFGSRLRYVSRWRKWLVWDGRRWKEDDADRAAEFAKKTAQRIPKEATGKDVKDDADILKWAAASLSRTKLDAMVDLARSDPLVRVSPDDLDADKWALNVRNGTVDLRTGELKAHDPRDLYTKICPVEHHPDAAAPKWEEFLRVVFDGDEELISFIRRAAGYSATGHTSEHVFLPCHGGGSNGKTTLFEVVAAVLGDYAAKAAINTFLAKRSEGIGEDKAALQGARFVAAAEPSKGRKLDAGTVKELTGDGEITCRRLYGDPFTYQPQFTLWIGMNHRPRVDDTSLGMWRRVLLVPFEVTIPEGAVVKDLAKELVAEEGPGILAWIVRGAVEWAAGGLQAPDTVRAATKAYQQESDPIGQWIDERCELTEDGRTLSADLWADWTEWAAEEGHEPGTKTALGIDLRDRGMGNLRMDDAEGRQKRGWGGIELRNASQKALPGTQ